MTISTEGHIHGEGKAYAHKLSIESSNPWTGNPYIFKPTDAYFEGIEGVPN